MGVLGEEEDGCGRRDWGAGRRDFGVRKMGIAGDEESEVRRSAEEAREHR